MEEGTVAGHLCVRIGICHTDRAPVSTLKDQVWAGWEFMTFIAPPTQGRPPVAPDHLSGEAHTTSEQSSLQGILDHK